MKITKELIKAALDVLNANRIATGEKPRPDSVLTHNVVTLVSQFDERDLRLAVSLLGNINRMVYQMEAELVSDEKGE